MKPGTTLYVKNRKRWRAWLEKNHGKAAEIWLLYYKKGSGKPRIPYNDAVEEALCFGWIDSILKAVDEDSYVQRFSPRRPDSDLSEANRERVRRLIRAGQMTEAGLAKLERHLRGRDGAALRQGRGTRLRLPADIGAALREDPVVWRNFKKFPLSYRRVRVGWIDMARARPEEFNKRLRYFIKMTARNKRYGMVQ